MATYQYQVSSGSATAAGDLGNIVAGVRNDSMVQINPTNLTYGNIAVDASGRVWTTGAGGGGAAGSQYSSGSATAVTDVGTVAVGVRNDALAQINPTNLAYGFYSVDASGRMIVAGTIGISGLGAATTAYVSGQVSAVQTTSPWIVSGNVSSTQVTSPWVVSASNQLTVSGNVSATQVTSPWVVSASNTLTVSPLSVTALVSGSALTAMVSGAYTRSSATAAGDTGLPAFAIMNVSAAESVNTSNLAYGLYSVDASGRVWSAGTNLEAASYAASMNGVTIMAVVTGGVPSYGASSLRFLVMDTGGALRVQPTGTVQVSGTAVQGTSPWVVSASNQLTVSGNVSATQVTSPWVVSGNVSATQVTSPWVVSASNQLTVSGNVSATVIGTATVTMVPATGGGWSKIKYADQTTTVRTVKGTAGTFGGYYFYNPNITVSYVQMFDTSAAVTLGTTVPDMIFGVPAGAAANIEFSNGINMVSAILLACTNSATGLTAPATGLDLTVFYK